MLQKKIARKLFEERIRPRISVGEKGCWTIPLKDNGHGYVYIRVRSLSLRIGIHVLAFCAFNENEPINVLHRCDNPPCCNPEHIFSGTQAENIKDMDAKGRRGVWHPIGNKNPSKQSRVRKKLQEFAKSRVRNPQGIFV